MDGPFYNDLREPFISADIAAVTLAATNKALYPPSNFPVLGGQYFARPGKKLRIRLFGKMTTGATPGSLTLGVYYGDGTDANGVLLQSSAAFALTASQANLSWWLDVFVHCRSIGSAGTLFVTGDVRRKRRRCRVHVAAGDTSRLRPRPSRAPAISPQRRSSASKHSARARPPRR
jgi:hypothetical protein